MYESRLGHTQRPSVLEQHYHVNLLEMFREMSSPQRISTMPYFFMDWYTEHQSEL